MVYVQPRVCPGEWNAQTPLGFWDTNRSPNLGQTTRPSNNQHQEKNLPNCWVCSHKVKFRGSEKKDKYLDLARGLKKTVEHVSDSYTNCNCCSCCCHRMLVQGLEDLEITGRVMTIQTTALLRSIRILRSVLKSWRYLLSAPGKNNQLTLMWKTTYITLWSVLTSSK